MTTLSPQAGRRYKLAAAFLLHWRDDDLGTEGALEVLHEAERGDLDGTALAGLLCAVAALFWEGPASGDSEPAALEYLRRVAARAAVDEVSGANDG
jgi:hypothetical protein